MYLRWPRTLSQEVEECADETLEAWRANQIDQEPDITTWFMSRIDSRLNGYEKGSIRIETKVYSSRSEEKVVGADFANILEITFDAFQVRKAFLAQAKKIPLDQLGRTHLVTRLLTDERLERQCKTMLGFTPASFVFVYSADGFIVFPALDVHSLVVCPSPRPEVYLHHKSTGSFYEEFFKTFLGDASIVRWVKDIEHLESFAREYRLQAALYLRITGRMPEWNGY